MWTRSVPLPRKNSSRTMVEVSSAFPYKLHLRLHITLIPNAVKSPPVSHKRCCTISCYRSACARSDGGVTENLAARVTSCKGRGSNPGVLNALRLKLAVEPSNDQTNSAAVPGTSAHDKSDMLRVPCRYMGSQ